MNCTQRSKLPSIMRSNSRPSTPSSSSPSLQSSTGRCFRCRQLGHSTVVATGIDDKPGSKLHQRAINRQAAQCLLRVYSIDRAICFPAGPQINARGAGGLSRIKSMPVSLFVQQVLPSPNQELHKSGVNKLTLGTRHRALADCMDWILSALPAILERTAPIRAVRDAARSLLMHARAFDDITIN